MIGDSLDFVGVFGWVGSWGHWDWEIPNADATNGRFRSWLHENTRTTTENPETNSKFAPENGKLLEESELGLTIILRGFCS